MGPYLSNGVQLASRRSCFQKQASAPALHDLLVRISGQYLHIYKGLPDLVKPTGVPVGGQASGGGQASSEQ
jgi:hypothetical protein